jgi:glutaredoxin 2
MDIVRYVDELYSPKILTEPPSEEIEAWCKEARPFVSKLVVPRMTKSLFKESSTEESRRAYIERETKAFGDLDSLIEDTPKLLGPMNQMLAKLEPLIQHRDAYSETDLVLFAMLRSLSIVQNIEMGPGTRAFVETMSAAGGVPLLSDQAK